MKKSMNIILMLTVLILASISVSAQTIKIPSINVSMINQDPDPVTPGRYVELRFKIFNNMYDTTAKNFEVMLDPKYPFSLDEGEEASKSLGDLPGYGNSRNSIIVKYKVRVDDNAIEGQNPITLKYRVDGSDWVSIDYNVDVQTIDANLAIVSVDTVPESIKPGDKATIKVKVKNMADSTMKDITMKLDLTFSSIVPAVTASDAVAAFSALPFAPLGSATEQKIDTLTAGEEKTFTYNLIAYSDAVSKVYKMPIQITYYDEMQTKYTKNDIIGVVVGAKPDLNVVIDETDIYMGKNYGTVTIKFINKGFTDIKFLNVKMEHTDLIDVLSTHEVYLGNVNSDDYETADFKVYIKDGKKEGTIDFPIIVEYRDANNNLYQETYNLPLEIIDPAKLGQSNTPNFWWIIIVLVVIVAAVFFFRRKKANKGK
jgi:hypothetical protein